MHISKRALKIAEEPFFIALNLPSDVVRLTAGEPDFPSAPFVLEAASRAVADHQTHYTAPAGIPPLRQGIARKLKEENNLSYDPSEVIVTPGSSGAVGLALIAMIESRRGSALAGSCVVPLRYIGGARRGNPKASQAGCERWVQNSRLPD